MFLLYACFTEVKKEYLIEDITKPSETNFNQVEEIKDFGDLPRLSSAIRAPHGVLRRRMLSVVEALPPKQLAYPQPGSRKIKNPVGSWSDSFLDKAVACFTMPSLLRQSLVCFYCGWNSGKKWNKTVANWQCTKCDAVNYLDEVWIANSDWLHRLCSLQRR